MPIESRLFVKTALAALVLAYAAGAAMAIARSVGFPVSPIWAVEHAHLAFVGWLVNIVIGIALWMLPLAREHYPRTAGRYPPWAPMTVYALLNGGLVLRILSEPFLATGISRERHCSFRRWRNLPPFSCSRTSPGSACARLRGQHRACDERAVLGPADPACGEHGLPGARVVPRAAARRSANLRRRARLGSRRRARLAHARCARRALARCPRVH